MAFREQVPRHLRFQEKRRGVRVNSRVPVAIEWETDRGGSVRARGHTRVVGPYGCLLVAPESLELEQLLRITNLVTRKSNPAVVVWKGNERVEGWELGIELIEPQMGFWGLEL